LDPPQHAAVFCVDEKTAIQASERAVLTPTARSPFVLANGYQLGPVISVA
jgi:hypothetical protein